MSHESNLAGIDQISKLKQEVRNIVIKKFDPENDSGKSNSIISSETKTMTQKYKSLLESQNEEVDRKRSPLKPSRCPKYYGKSFLAYTAVC